MFETQLVPVDAVVNPRERDPVVSVAPVTRYRYSKRGFSCLKYVIVDVFPDGYEEFSDQEAGEVCWYRFRPSTAERAAFHNFIETPANGDRWPLLDF